MPFKKGDKNINRNGRPRNVNVDKETALNRAFAALLPRVKKLSDSDLIKLLGVLMPYHAPKLQSIEHRDESAVNFDLMSDDQINRLANAIIENFETRKNER